MGNCVGRPAAGLFSGYRERKRLQVSFTRPDFVLHYRGFGPVSRHQEPENTRRNKNEFRSERGIPTGMGGSALGSLSALGGLAGPVASSVAGSLGPLAAGRARRHRPARDAARADRLLADGQDARRDRRGDQRRRQPARLTQLNRYVTLDTPLGPDVLLVSAAVVDEHVNRLPEIHLDLLSHRHDLRPEDLIGQQVKIRSTSRRACRRSSASSHRAPPTTIVTSTATSRRSTVPATPATSRNITSRRCRGSGS